MYTSDVQVQLRFAPVEKQTEDIKDMYPPCLVVRLNAKMIQLPVSLYVFTKIPCVTGDSVWALSCNTGNM